jgi:hypothetical protein
MMIWKRKKKRAPSRDDYVRKAHDDLLMLIDYLRGERALYEGQDPMPNDELANTLDLFVLRRLKRALDVVQGGDINIPTCI